MCEDSRAWRLPTSSHAGPRDAGSCVPVIPRPHHSKNHLARSLFFFDFWILRRWEMDGRASSVSTQVVSKCFGPCAYHVSCKCSHAPRQQGVRRHTWCLSSQICFFLHSRHVECGRLKARSVPTIMRSLFILVASAVALRVDTTLQTRRQFLSALPSAAIAASLPLHARAEEADDDKLVARLLLVRDQLVAVQPALDAGECDAVRTAGEYCRVLP